MIIDANDLSEEALDGLIEAYCLRDWGLNDTENPLSDRKVKVKQALKSGELCIQYSEHEESAHIVSSTSLGIG